MKNFFEKGQNLLGRKQGSILSAAFVILGLIAISRVLGLIRQRIFVHFFTPGELDIYLAALRIPETFFEILVAGSLASAFIPVFTSILGKGDKRGAWYVAGITQATLLTFFILLSGVVLIFAEPISKVLTPGFSSQDQLLMTQLTRFLLIAQGFFLLSFFISGIQESFQRFLVPAIAPLFYNLGMIFGAAFLHGAGVWGIAIGAVAGSLVQFIVQLPFVYQLGFRFIAKIDLREKEFRKIVKLALPRMGEIAFLQIAKGVELFLATTISRGSYTHYIFASSLQLFPVALFGYSLGKASFPTLANHASRGNKEEFISTLKFALGLVLFFIIPAAVILAVLRIPIVRLVFGAQNFDWDSTVQTGLALSAFSFAVVSQGVIGILARSLYAIQDTKTPMIVALFSTCVNIALSFWFITSLQMGVWGLAFSYSISSLLQAGILLILLNKRIFFLRWDFIRNIGKTFASSAVSGFVMYFLLKIFDQAVWDKRLSFLGDVGLALPTTFQVFVLDTRYTVNLIFLTLLVVTVGILVYVGTAALFRCREVDLLAGWIGKIAEREVSLPVARGKSELPAPLPPGG